MKTSVPVVVFCVACTVALSFGLIGMGGLSPIDNHTFMEQTFQGRVFRPYMDVSMGRFIPLTAQEFAWAARIFGWSVDLFYLIAASKIVMAAALLYWAIRASSIGPWSTVVLWSTAMFSPGFGNSSYRLQVAEIIVLVLGLLFVCLILAAERSAAGNPRAAAYMRAAGVCALAIGCFYKEVAFILPLVFGFFEVVRWRRSEQRKVPAYIWASMLIGIAYVAGYLAWRASALTGSSYASMHPVQRWEVLSRFAQSDPFMVFVAVPFAVYRIVRIVMHPREHSIFDSFLLASVVYAAAYLVLGLNSYYYLLPAYGFAICGVAGRLAELGRLQRGFVVAACAVCLLYSAPYAFSDIQSERGIAKGHQPFVGSLVEWIWKNPTPDGSARKIALAGVSTGFGVEIIYSLKQFMLAAGADPASFDVVGTENSTMPLITSVYKLSPVGHRAMPGDILVFNPYQEIGRVPPSGASFADLGMGGESWVIPRWNGFQWIRYCVLQPSGCQTSITGSRRTTGYTAYLMRREPQEAAFLDVRSTAYRVGPYSLPSRVAGGIETKVKIEVQNAGGDAWPAEGKIESLKVVNMAYVWLNAGGGVVLEGGRSAFAESILPGESATVSVTVKAPQAPGNYRLVLSPVQEGVKWFYWHGDGARAQGSSKVVEIY